MDLLFIAWLCVIGAIILYLIFQLFGHSIKSWWLRNVVPKMSNRKMNKQVQTQTKRSIVLLLISGSIVLLIGFLIYGYSSSTLFGQGSGAGFELFFLYLFVVLPLLIIGVVLVVRGLLRQRSNVFVTVGAFLLIGPLTSVILAASYPQSFFGYGYLGPVETMLALLGNSALSSLVVPVLVIVGLCLFAVGLRGTSQAIENPPTI